MNQSLAAGLSGYKRGTGKLRALCQSSHPKLIQVAARAGRALLPPCVWPDSPTSPSTPYISQCLPCSQQPGDLSDLSAACCLQPPGHPHCHPGRPAALDMSIGHSSMWSHARQHSSGWDMCLPSGRIRIWPCVLIALHVFCLKHFQSPPVAILCGVWQQRLQSRARETWLHDALFLPKFQL